MGARRRGRGLSDLRLKIIVLILTLLSALSGVMADDAVSGAGGMAVMTAAVACEAASWAGAPVCAWLLAEGHRHTRSDWRYAGRLLLLAVVSEAPYDLATSGVAFDPDGQNPVFALLLALLTLMLLDRVRATHAGVMRGLLSAVVVAAAVLWALLLRLGVRQRLVSLGVLIVGMAVIFHLMRAAENMMMFAAGLFGAVMFVTPAVGVAVLHYRRTDDAAGVVPHRPLFYALYPILLLVPYAIGALP